ncbi:2-pyrone-4,6-dicarboxylate hydrolase [Corticibacter populi]|uniref:2-pyrone-4,6-dicarboxylate hydrolase n=1 Tax=Corticibacter populi TaxID=1550736 RepID=A0A3M6QVI3_9BURK|nr:amidohydrolase family protein [Corticibacter populi]RMX06502.1 2-pyrone-4,6-dicarboxylate hydrolase [Corticibacter populi]RZS31938.1 putative TIM-barrel fold metal-dependent hydrolase [Corticibacter populi]
MTEWPPLPQPPHSAAGRSPRLVVPANACDAHLHIYDARFPHTPDLPANADVAAYRQLQALLGTSRAVVVQPRVHGTDNRVTLEAIAQLGRGCTRGIAVVAPDIDDASLMRLHEGGIRGIRLSLHAPNQNTAGFAEMRALAHRIREMGWHLQLHWSAEQIVAHQDMLADLPVDVVFDHMARLPVTQGTRHAAFDIVRRLLARERAWLKISGFYLDAPARDGSWPDALPIATAWIEAAPQRLVWGSDWPHITEGDARPDAAALLELLAAACGDRATLTRILVDNPARLYQFER